MATVGNGSMRRLLVVATAPDPADELRERVRDYAGEGVEILVVAPTSDISLLEWLTSDEDSARREAEQRAGGAAEAVPVRIRGAVVGDVDPLVAIEDALRVFPADELILVTRPEETATWFEQDALAAFDRFGLPVTHLVDDDVELQRNGSARATALSPKVDKVAREIVRGESEWTGFLAQKAVFLVVAAVAAVMIAIGLILYLSLR
jgi:hypothetical protein